MNETIADAERVAAEGLRRLANEFHDATQRRIEAERAEQEAKRRYRRGRDFYHALYGEDE